MGQVGTVQTINIGVNCVKVGDGYLAYAVIGGVRVSGGRRNSAYEATTSLFAVLAGTSGDNSAAALAIELGLAGVDIDSLPSLTDGN